jgi:EAL domain-containing protein (putative c-di-GMP-specific phosphodiesterase class I)
VNAPDKLPPETRQPVSGYLWGALAVLTCPCHLPILAACWPGRPPVPSLASIGCCRARADRLVRSGRNAAAARLPGRIMTSSQPAGWTAAELAQAAARGQLDLHYQPLVDLRDHRIAGAEALMRWRHPRLGLLPPGQFLPLAESFGLMPEIGAWVLGEACRQMHKWQGPAWQPFRLAINVSASEVGPTFDDEVKRVLADMALPAELLEIELTESVAFGNPALFASFDALRAIGVRFAADDFGTGYSCLQHLKCCPITTLKIDQSFVAGLPDDARDQTIVRAVIQLAHGLGMDVIFRRRLHQLIGRNGCCAASS